MRFGACESSNVDICFFFFGLRDVEFVCEVCENVGFVLPEGLSYCFGGVI